MKREIQFVEVWDKPTLKGFPSKESIVVTIALYQYDGDATAGYAFKMPGDQHVPRIGRGIARHAKYSNLFDVNPTCPEKYLLRYLDVVNKKFPSKIMDRLKAIAGVSSIGMKSSAYKYRIQPATINYIED
jgi:hypothetical protein